MTFVASGLCNHEILCLTKFTSELYNREAWIWKKKSFKSRRSVSVEVKMNGGKYNKWENQKSNDFEETLKENFLILLNEECRTR